MDWTTGVLLLGIHMALVATVVAMVWNGPLSKHTVKVADKRKAAEDLKKRLDIIE